MSRTNNGYQGGREGGKNWESGIDIYTLICVRTGEPTAQHREVYSILCGYIFFLFSSKWEENLKKSRYMYTCN